MYNIYTLYIYIHYTLHIHRLREFYPYKAQETLLTFII